MAVKGGATNHAGVCGPLLGLEEDGLVVVADGAGVCGLR